MYSIDDVAILGAIFVVPLIILLFRKRGFSYIFFYSVFAVYLLFAIEEVFFPIHVGGGFQGEARRNLASHINYSPFYFGRFGTLQSSLMTLILNIVLTIPFGFGVSFVVSIKPKTILWFAPLVGLITEGGQLLILLFQPYSFRIVDINDVLMNALGVIVGYGLFRIFAWLYVSLTAYFDVKHKGLKAYVYEISQQNQVNFL